NQHPRHGSSDLLRKLSGDTEGTDIKDKLLGAIASRRGDCGTDGVLQFPCARCLRVDIQAALAVRRCSCQAQSSHGRSASTSAVSTVGPVQMRSPGGEARWLAIS